MMHNNEENKAVNAEIINEEISVMAAPDAGSDEEEKKKKRKKILIIILFLILIGIIAALSVSLITQENKSAVIVESDVETEAVRNNGMRVKFNTYITVQEDTMQDFMFYNLNETWNLQCKINIGDKENPVYIYESPVLETGKVIQADVIKTSRLEPGENEALVEVYTLNKETGEVTGESDVEVILNLK